MAIMRFNWSIEPQYRACFAELLRAARNTAALGASAGLDHVYLTTGYQTVVERTCADYDSALRRKVYPTGLSYIEGCALIAVADVLGAAQLGRTFFLDQSKIDWVDHLGCEFTVETIFAACDGTVLVATPAEFPLDERFWIDRQLFKAEANFVTRQISRYRRMKGDAL